MIQQNLVGEVPVKISGTCTSTALHSPFKTVEEFGGKSLAWACGLRLPFCLGSSETEKLILLAIPVCHVVLPDGQLGIFLPYYISINEIANVLSL